MDMDTVCCSNPECYEEIEKKKNGEFPKCCPECGAKVVHAQLDPVVICSSCHEEIARKKNGELPKCCTECGVAVALPGRQLSIQELRCSCAACGEKLPKNSKGEYTKYCPNCSQPVGIPDAVFPRSMLSCSSCGHQVGRNKKGVFPKYCPECDFELKVESSQVGGQRLNVQPTSFHNPKESGSLSPTSVGRSSSPSTHMPATPSTDAAATPSTDAPTTPRKDVPVTPSADVPATPSTDVPATPSPIADVPQPKSSLLASDQVPAGFNESHYHKAATEQCMSSGQTGLNRSIDSLHDTKNQLKQGDGGTVSIGNGPPFVSMDSSGVVTEEPKNGQTKSVNLQSYVIVDRQGSEQVNEESVKDCEEKMQDTNTPNTGIEELHSSETSVYTQPRCQEKTQLGSSMPPGLPQIAGATLQSQSNASGGSRINPANIQYYGRDLPNQDQPTGGNNAPGLSTAITSDNPVFSDQLKLTDTVSCPPDQPREEEQRDESDDEHYHMAGDSSLDPPERKENTSVSTSDNAVLSDHLKLTGTATCPPHRFERGVPPTTTRSLPLDMDEHARGIEKNAKQLLGASDPSAKTQSLPLKVLGQYVGSESAFVEQFKPRGKVTRSQSLQHESATDTETVKSERESSSVLVPSSGASPHFSPTSSAHAFSAQAIPVGGEVVAGDTAGREQRDGYDNAEKEDHMASDNSFVPPKQKENISVSGPMSSSVRGSDLGTDVDAIVGRPEQHAGEVDVVEVFLDLKVCLNDVHRMVLMKDMCVRHMKTQEEDFVEKEKKEAQRLYARYESTVRNAGGGTQAAAEAQNSLRKFINGKSEQLNQILLRHNLGKLNVLHVQKPGRGSPVQTRSRQRQLIEKTKEVTFKAVLSSAIVKKFQKVDKTPTVEIVSDFYDNFLSVLVRLERTKEDIWVGKWNAPDSNRTLRYKYFVHDGVEIHGDCFEWLGQDTYNVIINRCLFLPGLTHGQVIYDGIVMWRDSVLTSLKRAVTSDKFKDDERARGMLTMLPNWTEEMEKGTPIQDLFNWVNAVLWRQGELFGRFSAFTRNYYYQSAAAHIPQVNEVFQEYITIGLTLHKSLLGNFAEKATILASLLGLIHLAMSSDARSVSVRQLLQMSPQFVDDTMDAVSHGYDKDASSELFSHIALGDESFVRSVLKSLTQVIQLSFLLNDSWIRLIPIVNLLKHQGKNQLAERGTNYDTQKWWGVEDVADAVKHVHRSMGDVRRWRCWYQWLSPFFSEDSLLPYMFLALLRAGQLLGVMEERDIDIIQNIPLDGFLACTRYHFKTSVSNRKEMMSALKHVCYVVKPAGQRKLNMDLCLDILESLTELLLPLHSSMANIDQSVVDAVQVYLLVMHMAIARNENAEVSALGLPLTGTIRRIVNVLDSQTNQYYGGQRLDFVKISDSETKLWQALFSCPSSAKVASWWSDLCKQSLKDRLEKVAFSSPMAIVDLYCSQNFDIPAMNETVAESAFPHAEHLLKAGDASHLTRNRTNYEKIGKLVDKALSKAWDAQNESSMSIVRNMVKWGNFLSVWRFYKKAVDAQVAHCISEENEDRLAKSVSSLEDVIRSLTLGSITFGDFEYLQDNQGKVIDLCEVSTDLYSSLPAIKNAFTRRQEEKEAFVRFLAEFSDFWSCCGEYVKEADVINQWLRRKHEELTFHENLSSSPIVVLCPDIPKEIRDILLPFKEKKQRKIFRVHFDRTLKEKKQYFSLSDVSTVYRSSVEKYEEICGQLSSGNVSIARFEKYMEVYFNRDMSLLDRELQTMLNGHNYRVRKRQIDVCYNFNQYHEGAEVMLKMKEEFKLTGDFSDFEKIMESKDKKLLLKDISEQLIARAASVKHITPLQIECLQVYAQHPDVVKWAKEEVPKNDINTFVDLASSTLGDDALAAQKTRYLLNALTGYSPFLYDFDSNKTDQASFMDLCQKVWDTLKQNPELPDNLRKSSTELEWLKKVKTHYGKVEIKSIAQATAINKTGVYRVGNIEGHSNYFKSLEDVMVLSVTVEDTATKEHGDGVTKKEVTYKYSDLKNLQSKLTLAAGEEQTKNKETIQTFDDMRDAVENLAQAYLDIRREGCIQFDDMVVYVHCHPEHTTAIEVKLQSIGQVMTGARHEKTALQHCQYLHRYLTNCLEKWRSTMVEKRREYAELNFYTTEQLVVLRKELGEYLHSAQVNCLKQSLPLLAMIHPMDTALLHKLLTDYSKMQAENSAKVKQEAASDQSLLAYEDMDGDQQDFVHEICDDHEDFTKELAVQVVNELGFDEPSEVYMDWIEEYVKKMEESAAVIENAANNLLTSSQVMTEVMKGGGNTLDGKLANLWEKFTEKTTNSIKDLLGIAHLAHVLKTLQGLKPAASGQRKLPEWLGRGKPILLAVPQRKMYQMVLTIYQWDTTFPAPTRNEVLICNGRTQMEEAKLFLDRALADPNSFYCMVNCHLLTYEVCRLIETRLSHTADDKVKDYGLAFIYAEERRDARIRAYLDKQLVKNQQYADPFHLRDYVKEMLKVPADMTPTASANDPDGFFARLIRSKRAGVGKSLYKAKLLSDLKIQGHTGKLITIPVYKTINTDDILRRLSGDGGNGDSLYDTVHMDIAHEVESGVDELLFNLIILRSIVNSEGVVWQAQTSQYYIIECMPFTKGGESIHEVLDLLPTTWCKTPEEVLAVYKTHQTDMPDNFIAFDETVLKEREWQTVLKFLHQHEKGDITYTLSEDEFTDPRKALEILLRNCGLRDPTWSELRHYVYFLSNQLFKVQESPYCIAAAKDDLPGFREFVVKFMFQMAKDFATRSLKIAEQTPGLNLHELQDRSGDAMLKQLEMKRTWESEKHPYLFFNEDGATFTPLGFYAEAINVLDAYSLVDCTTKDVLAEKVISRELKRALDQHNFSMSEDFDKLKRSDQLRKLRSVMVLSMYIVKEVKSDGTIHHEEELLFASEDPDKNYVLTMDNAKKILAIHQRLSVDIPVIIMGETGCGKTKLIEFMSRLQVPSALASTVDPMIIVKIHGGTTEEDIIQKVQEAQELAIENKRLCTEFANVRGSTQVPKVYTILFLDEANTTEAIGLVKEILCDGRMKGEPLDRNSGLKIIAACNPYRKHSDEMIVKLKKAGLGYSVGEEATTDKFGHIPMRHLVYRVQPLSQSLLPLVWDFGTLKSKAPEKLAASEKGDVESAYIKQMIVNFNVQGRSKGDRLNFRHHTATIADLLSATQTFMREQKDECSFVSLRDVQRLLDVAGWFYSQRHYVFDAIDRLDGVDLFKELEEEDTDDEEIVRRSDATGNHACRSVLLAIGVCYLARLEDATRLIYARKMNKLQDLIRGAGIHTRLEAADYLLKQIDLCQDLFINEVVTSTKSNHKNIAKNKALKENVFMMIVCIENRIPLFLVGKPGSSKSLSKSMVVDAMKGTGSDSEMFKKMKQAYMVSFQCSKHATPAGIVGVFNHCANFQKSQDLTNFVSVVVLDEVGLAEDSENMPLKALHPLLENGCEGNTKPEPYMKCAFVGISNWALDPAKMNRGIFVQRGTPQSNELVQIAKEICRSAPHTDSTVGSFIDSLARGYLEICQRKKPDERALTEFFGLRDFYSLMKMVVNFAVVDGPLNRNQLEHSIKRNFGGFDQEKFDPLAIFKEHCASLESLKYSKNGQPPIDSIGLIQSSLSGRDTAHKGMESRYLLILTENLSVLSIILNEFATHSQQPEVVFGSRFRDDVSYTQVCHNIYRIKTCMDMGKPVILLNLDDLYESLYDALNQYFSTWGDRKFVDIGLGTHRVKAFVNDKFRLVVIADKNKVHTQFPIPLINRLEKHYVSATSLLEPKQRKVQTKLEEWAKQFVTPSHLQGRGVICPDTCHGCKSILSVPYRLPCLQHYVGPCCKTKIVDGQQKCPVCNTVIRDDFEWAVDTMALENRQYFENCTRETAFIGYSTETTALAVRVAAGDVSHDSSNYQRELLKRSKFHLLQCATGEAVLRLEKTELFGEAKSIQDTYLLTQSHETLLQYLSNEMSKAADANAQPSSKVHESLCIQVTTFAELMNSRDVETFTHHLNQAANSVEVKCVYLKEFVKENQFTNALREFYSKKSKSACKVLLVQCESANDNVELLDSVRYIIQRECANEGSIQRECANEGSIQRGCANEDSIQRECADEGSIQRECADEGSSTTHTVLLLNIPRGHAFNGYQGGNWRCVHIDDPRSPEIRLPILSVCLKLTPSQIIHKLMAKEDIIPGDQEDGPPPLEAEDVAQEQEDYPDYERYEEDDVEVPPALDDRMFDDVLLFIIRCLPAALSLIKTDQPYDRASLLSKLFNRNSEFVQAFLSLMHVLLKEQEEQHTETHWVKTEAVKASNMKQSETMRHALEDSLERAFVPALAAVIAFTDVRENLQLLNSNSPFVPLWMEIFSQSDKLGLNFSALTRRNSDGSAQATLPQSYSISQVGDVRQTFRVQFPFSWLVKSCIDNLTFTTKDAVLHFDESFITEQFKMTPIGKVVMKVCSNAATNTEMLQAYIADFVYMSHPSSDDTEHWIVCSSIRKFMEDNHSNTNIMHVHWAYLQLQPIFDNLSSVVNLFGDFCDLSPIREQMSKDQPDTSMACDLAALHHLVQALWNVRLPIITEDPEKWVGQVDRCTTVATRILDSVDQNDEKVVKCRGDWLNLLLKKLYVQHVIAPSPINARTGRRGTYQLAHFINKVKKDEKQTEVGFKQSSRFQLVVKFLQETVRSGIQALFSGSSQRCPDVCPGTCKQQLGAPVILKCGHFLCEACVKEAHHCPTDNCGKMIPADIQLLSEAQVDGDKLAEFKSLRKRLNRFFMHFVSDLVFGGEPEPEDAVIEWLLECTTYGTANATRQFSLFNSSDVIDPTPVLRSYLLKLLLKCDQSNAVSAHINQELARWSADESSKLKTIVLLMDCYKDMYSHVLQQDGVVLHATLSLSLVTEPTAVASLTTLKGLADLQSYLILSVNLILSVRHTRSIKQLGDNLQEFLSSCIQSGNKQPGYFVIRQLVATRGKSYLKDMLAKPLSYLIPEDVKEKLKSYTVPDLFSYFGGSRYQDTKSALDKLIASSPSPPDFPNAVKQFKQVCQTDTAMFPPIFTCITRTLVGTTPVSAKFKQNLLTELAGGSRNQQTTTMLQLLLEDGKLPQAMDVGQSNGIQMAMLVLNIYSCVGALAATKTDLNPLAELIHQTEQAGHHFLPTMADSRLEEETTNKSKLDEPCGSVGEREIGATSGDFNTKPGHILGPSTDRPGPHSLRKLNSLSCAVLRCLTHLCMYTASLFNRQQVWKMIRPALNHQKAVEQFLDQHIQLDLQHIADCCTLSVDDCILLLHDVINRVKRAGHQGEYVVLDSIQKRANWEGWFDVHYIKPTFGNQIAQLQAIKSKLKITTSGDLDKMLSTENKTINADNILSSAGLWVYRQPLTLPALQNILHNSVKEYPCLKSLVNNSELLLATQYLPDILELIRTLNGHFHSKFSRKDAMKTSIASFCSEHRATLPNMENLITLFLTAWKILLKQTDMPGERLELTKDSPLKQLLIDQTKTTSPAYLLVKCLTEAHNKIISSAGSQRSHIKLAAVSRLNVVSLKDNGEIINLVAAHREYELKESTSVNYNWAAIERDVLNEYINNKAFIDFSKDQLPYFIFQEDFDLHNQMLAIDHSQELLSPEMQASIVKALSGRMQALTTYLKELKVVVNFLSVMSHIEKEDSLADSIDQIFGRDAGYLSEEVKLKHVKHVWLVIKYTQTDLLMRQRQEPFDDIDPKCRETLSVAQTDALDMCCTSHSPKTKLLLQELFKYITLRLNRISVEHHFSSSSSASKGLDGSLREFIQSNKSDAKMLEELPSLPESLLVEHAANAWRYIWTRYTN